MASEVSAESCNQSEFCHLRSYPDLTNIILAWTCIFDSPILSQRGPKTPASSSGSRKLNTWKRNKQANGAFGGVPYLKGRSPQEQVSKLVSSLASSNTFESSFLRDSPFLILCRLLDILPKRRQRYVCHEILGFKCIAQNHWPYDFRKTMKLQKTTITCTTISRTE